METCSYKIDSPLQVPLVRCFPEPVSLISINKCSISLTLCACFGYFGLSVLQFLASTVRADASQLEAGSACCAVNTLTQGWGGTDSSSWPTCWPLQKSIPQGSGYNRNVSLFSSSCNGIFYDYISISVDSQLGLCEYAYTCLQNSVQKCLKALGIGSNYLRCLPAEKWIIEAMVIIADMQGALLCQYFYTWQS